MVPEYEPADRFVAPLRDKTIVSVWLEFEGPLSAVAPR
jgi:hypothetical protein